MDQSSTGPKGERRWEAGEPDPALGANAASLRYQPATPLSPVVLRTAGCRSGASTG
jgi:hypothetical protein